MSEEIIEKVYTEQDVQNVYAVGLAQGVALGVGTVVCGAALGYGIYNLGCWIKDKYEDWKQTKRVAEINAKCEEIHDICEDIKLHIKLDVLDR